MSRYSVPEIDRLASHFNAMAVALEQLETDNRRLTEKLLQVQENERAALARELHDDLGQHVTGIRAQAYVIPFKGGDNEQLQDISRQIIDSCDAMHQSFRQLIEDLYPVVLEQLGLDAAIDELLQNFQRSNDIRCVYKPQGFPRFNHDQAAHLYRLMQEALHNVSRHANARQIIVSTLKSDGHWLLRIADDGKGMPADPVPGIGLRSIQHRCRLLGADCTIGSAMPNGVVIEIALPLRVIDGDLNENSACR